ncbi:hypothetical protein BGY98DRAFT_1100803 [Russula aff. rugulosa BPL654]|nr:hypothetical protein BGY98DRAFT_1100803 [Russula aff. rugulosa BPL654]
MSEYLPGLGGPGPESDIDFTGFDTDGFSGNQSDPDIKSRSATPSPARPAGHNELDNATSNNEVKPPKKKLKGKNKALKGAEKKTAARPGISTPTPAQKESASKVGKGVMDRFAETAKMEEETLQKHLNLKKTKVLAQVEEKKAKIGAQRDIQMVRDRMKMEYKLKKERIRMEQMKMELELHHSRSGLGHLSHGLESPSPSHGSLFSPVPSFPTSIASGPSYFPSISPLTQTYSEHYSRSATPYMSQTDGHSSQANSAPSISSSFSNDAL